MYKKIIVIGDVRGDSKVLVKSLELANLIKHNKWVGKDTIVIQIGNTLSGKSTTSPPLSKEYVESQEEIAGDVRMLELMMVLRFLPII